MKIFRILVADDHEIVRLGVRSMLEAHESWQICGEAADGREAVEKTGLLKPDLIILDTGMPHLNGLDAARRILHNGSRCSILILTDDDSERVMREALRAGVRGFLFKSDPGCELIAAVEALQQGTTFFTSRVADLVLGGYLNDAEKNAEHASRVGALTSREREIIQLLAEGKTTKEVAWFLDLSVKTAETHRANIMRKLKLHSIAELVLYAVRNNVVCACNSTISVPMPAKVNATRARSDFGQESIPEHTPLHELPESATFYAAVGPRHSAPG
jgi:DNA-binding NarL/FixJ family response regulator